MIASTRRANLVNTAENVVRQRGRSGHSPAAYGSPSGGPTNKARNYPQAIMPIMFRVQLLFANIRAGL